MHMWNPLKWIKPLKVHQRVQPLSYTINAQRNARMRVARTEYITWIAHVFGDTPPPLETLSMWRINSILQIRTQAMKNAARAKILAKEEKKRKEEEETKNLLERIKKEQT